jgi:hypothetical protein
MKKVAPTYGKIDQFLHAIFGIERENRVLELEGIHSGHVWYVVGAENS